jgi:ResB-like family
VRALLERGLAVLGSYGLACLLLLDLFLLTFFGTLHQVEAGLYDAQKLYFESWWVVQREPIPLVLPGGLLCMGLLAVNLFVGGFVRIQKSKRTVGILVVHVGIALLLASGFVKLYHSDDGYLRLREGQASDEYVSYHLWEVAVWEASQRGPVTEHLIPHEHLVDLTDGRARTFWKAGLPFELELSGFLRNCEALPKGPMWQADSPVVGGFALKRLEDDPENENNVAGLTARFRALEGGATKEDLLWGFEFHPATFDAGGKTWAVSLRKARYPMPFTIRLEDFRKEDHPGLAMARSYESDVTKLVGGLERPIRIQMNEPLRDGGLVLFQSSFAMDRDGTEVSVFSVVRNPSDHWPLYACIVIGLGLVIAFLPKLFKFIRAQGPRRAATGVS